MRDSGATLPVIQSRGLLQHELLDLATALVPKPYFVRDFVDRDTNAAGLTMLLLPVAKNPKTGKVEHREVWVAVFVADTTNGQRRSGPTLLIGGSCGMTEALCKKLDKQVCDLFAVDRKFSRMRTGTASLATAIMSMFQRMPKLWDGSLSTYEGTMVPIELVEGNVPYIATWAQKKHITEAGQREALRQWLQEGLESGLLVKCEKSSWGAAIVIAPKPDPGEWRICQNFVRCVVEKASARSGEPMRVGKQMIPKKNPQAQRANDHVPSTPTERRVVPAQAVELCMVHVDGFGERVCGKTG